MWIMNRHLNSPDDLAIIMIMCYKIVVIYVNENLRYVPLMLKRNPLYKKEKFNLSILIVFATLRARIYRRIGIAYCNSTACSLILRHLGKCCCHLVFCPEFWKAKLTCSGLQSFWGLDKISESAVCNGTLLYALSTYLNFVGSSNKHVFTYF